MNDLSLRRLVLGCSTSISSVQFNRKFKKFKFSNNCQVVTFKFTLPLVPVKLSQTCRVLAKRVVTFRKRSTQSEFLDIFYCGHVTYQYGRGSKNLKETWIEQTRQTLMPSGLQEPKKGRFWDFLSNRLVIKFLPP